MPNGQDGVFDSPKSQFASSVHQGDSSPCAQRPLKRPRHFPGVSAQSHAPHVNLKTLTEDSVPSVASPSRPRSRGSQLQLRRPVFLFGCGDGTGGLSTNLLPTRPLFLKDACQDQSVSLPSGCPSVSARDTCNSGGSAGRCFPAVRPAVKKEVLVTKNEVVLAPGPTDIPSPPTTDSSDEDVQRIEVRPPPLPRKSKSLHQSDFKLNRPIPPTVPAKTLKRKRNKFVVEESKAPSVSQDSAFFSFSRHAPSQNSPKRPRSSANAATAPKQEPNQRERYYTKAFNFVIEQVLDRYSQILKDTDVALARLIQSTLDENALALFVRIYRRKQPHWFRVSGLQESYGAELDLFKAIDQLCINSLIASSKHASKENDASVLPLLARELLPTLGATEMKQVCGSIVEGKTLKRLPKSRLLPALHNILSDAIDKPQKSAKKYRQMTFSGFSPAQCLAKSVLKVAGHSVSIPSNVLASLARIHFLFFLEDGHDSPNVILADTGKARFPSYVCEPSDIIFPSAFAYERYEEAIGFEQVLTEELESGNYEGAANLGSVAELEVREFFKEETASPSDDNGAAEESVIQHCGTPLESSEDEAGGSSLRPVAMTKIRRTESQAQLKHPFFRRYTAPYIYARACWHSVHALERLGEHEGAVSRLRLLLSTELMPRRRGKCLNRLTINLFKHLQQLAEPLDIILDALGSDDEPLTFGDQLQLAHRGIAIHRKLALPEAEAKVKHLHKSVSARRKAAAAEVMAMRPQVLVDVLIKNRTQMAVRKIFGKSLNVRSNERREKVAAIEDPWQKFLAENSRDSLASAGDRSLAGKAVFSSWKGDGSEVSVEQYCLEWYFAKDGWKGVHDEGGAIRFLFSLLMWDAVIFKTMSDVFQTPYQDRPLDLMTEAFYESRKAAIELRVSEVRAMTATEICEETMALYEKFEGTRAIGCAWAAYSKEDLGCIAGGLGGQVIARCCQHLCEDYGYWCGGLPDLMLWRHVNVGSEEQEQKEGKDENVEPQFESRLVEVKSARDVLSERQRAWLLALGAEGASCEVCKVVERVTAQNATELEDAELDYVALDALAAASKEVKVKVKKEEDKQEEDKQDGPG